VKFFTCIKTIPFQECFFKQEVPLFRNMFILIQLLLKNKNLIICHHQMVTIPASYLESFGLKSSSRDWLFCVIFFVVFLSPSRHILGSYPNIRPSLAPSTSFPIHHSLIIILFNVI
jgi:hypothetical protein